MRRVTDLGVYQHIVMLSAVYRYCVTFLVLGLLTILWYFLSYKPLHLLYKTALEQQILVQQQCQTYALTEQQLKNAQKDLALKKEHLYQASATSTSLFFFEKAPAYHMTLDQLVVKASGHKKQWVEASVHGSYEYALVFLKDCFSGEGFYIKNITLQSHQTDQVKISFSAVIPGVL